MTQQQPAARPDPAADEAVVRALLGQRTIVLIGMMGAGKSSLGKRLAARLDLPFVDADSEIEAAANTSIAEIFSRYGEAFFREGERRVIHRLLNGNATVLATGGGAYMNPDTRAAIAASRGLAIWLKADFETLLARVRRRAGQRPLLSGGNVEAKLRKLIEERYPVYAGAPLHVSSRDVPHDTVVDDMLHALAEHLRAEVPSPRGGEG
jgi:shikimate kinase